MLDVAIKRTYCQSLTNNSRSSAVNISTCSSVQSQAESDSFLYSHIYIDSSHTVSLDHPTHSGSPLAKASNAVFWEVNTSSLPLPVSLTLDLTFLYNIPVAQGEYPMESIGTIYDTN